MHSVYYRTEKTCYVSVLLPCDAMQARPMPSCDVRPSVCLSACLLTDCNIVSCDGPWRVDYTVAGKQRGSLMAGDDDEMFMKGSFNVTSKRTEQRLIGRSGKSEA